ncbi:MAG: hypothetical protein L0Y44_15565 [Phycisphaerales bacterium]|nr:hypothetical protein [Phycisphaerales bacterium]MCI0632063.1 hypothetical protein [Phycisphaerales bacterium]
MARNWHRTIIGAVVAILALAPTAQATNYVSIVAPSGNWNSSSSWSPTGVPGSGDTATIVANDTINVTDSRSVDNVAVSGELRINGGSLTVPQVTVNSGGQLYVGDGSDSGGTLTVSGAGAFLVVNQSNGLVLVDQNSTLAFGTTCNIGTTGSGGILGLHNDATIDLVPASGTTVTVTANAVIHGALTIEKSGAGTGNFLNNLLVWADATNGTLKLDASLSGISDSSGGSCGRWGVEASGAALQFDKTASIGGVSVGPGALVVNADLSAGVFKFMAGGAVDINQIGEEACFSFDEFCGGSDCTPSSPICEDVDCLK